MPYWAHWPAWLSVQRGQRPTFIFLSHGQLELQLRVKQQREKETKTKRDGKKTDAQRKDSDRPMHFSKTMIRIAKEALRQGIWGHSSAWVANQKKAICHWCFWADDAVCGLNRECAQQVGLIRQKAEQESCWLLFESCQYVCIWSVSFIWKFLMAKGCTTSDCYCMV